MEDGVAKSGHSRFKIKHPGLIGRLRKRPIHYEGPFGPVWVHNRDSEVGTVAYGPNVPTVTIPVTPKTAFSLTGPWRFNGTIGDQAIEVWRDKPGFRALSYDVNVDTLNGRYTWASRGVAGVAVARSDGVELVLRGSGFNATAPEVALVLTVGCSGLLADVSQIPFRSESLEP